MFESNNIKHNKQNDTQLHFNFDADTIIKKESSAKKFEFRNFDFLPNPSHLLDVIEEYTDFMIKNGDGRERRIIFDEGVKKVVSRYSGEISSLDSSPALIKKYANELWNKKFGK